MVSASVKKQFLANKESWKKSFIEGFSQDGNGSALPWMSYPAIEFLKNNLTKNHEIFEFGCGASTLFFAKRVKKITGLETNQQWLTITQGLLSDQEKEKIEFHLMPDGLQNNAYENFAKNCGKKFDFIIIDSLKRFESAKNSITALKPNGTIILDDSERLNYKKIFDFFAQNNFQKQDFFGIAPAQLRIKNTTFFTKK